jgi:hypothetical protein
MVNVFVHSALRSSEFVNYQSLRSQSGVTDCPDFGVDRLEGLQYQEPNF